MGIKFKLASKGSNGTENSVRMTRCQLIRDTVHVVKVNASAQQSLLVRTDDLSDSVLYLLCGCGICGQPFC